jgi:hypothetical protein
MVQGILAITSRRNYQLQSGPLRSMLIEQHRTIVKADTGRKGSGKVPDHV